MSAAGHIADMISRMKNNRLHHDERRDRQKKVMDSLNKPTHLHEQVHDIEMSETDRKELILNIRHKLVAKNRKALQIQTVAILVIGIVVCYLFFRLIF